MIKLRRVEWAGHVARMGNRNAYMILVGKPERKRQQELDVGGRVILK
jgi:hypothetical protein